MSQYGTLRGIGVGPGDPQLLTFKAADLLRQSVVIAYVVDDQGESYARRIAAAHIPVSVTELPLHYSMSPQRDVRLAARTEVARQVIALLSTGQDVTFITEGDPLLYSTFHHLLTLLPSEVPLEICPGVSSLTASAAEAHFPLPIEGERMVVAPLDTEALLHISEWLESFEVIVLFKAHRHVQALWEELQKVHYRGRAVLVQRASVAGQARVVELASWDGSPMPYFTMALIRSGRGM